MCLTNFFDTLDSYVVRKPFIHLWFTKGAFVGGKGYKNYYNYTKLVWKLDKLVKKGHDLTERSLQSCSVFHFSSKVRTDSIERILVTGLQYHRPAGYCPVHCVLYMQSFLWQSLCCSRWYDMLTSEGRGLLQQKCDHYHSKEVVFIY